MAFVTKIKPCTSVSVYRFIPKVENAMKIIGSLLVALMMGSPAMANQDSVQHISKLEVNRKKKEVFAGRDSVLRLHIDTLIMHDRAQLVFLGKKHVELTADHVEMAKRAYIFGTDGKNNGTDFNIDMRFEELGALYVLAGGQDANNNGSRTYPNGDGGTVNFVYRKAGITPQTADRKSPHYLRIDTRAGGYRGTPQNELRNIYGLINSGPIGRPLGRLSQGTVYSGSPGTDGTSTITAK